MNDIKFAIRQLLKSPVFSTVAILTFALGIGACTAMFSIVNRVVLRPLPCADPGQLVLLVLGAGFKLTLAGIALGLLGGYFFTRLIATHLFGVSATDPLTLVGVTLLLVAVALLACWLPARRATRIDPLEALRAE
jgi:putative ABC transport system permease protein